MVKLYTKRGDRGNTTLYNGDIVRKDHCIFNALGCIDDLQANIAVLKTSIMSSLASQEQYDFLSGVQSSLVQLCSCIATPSGRNYESTRFPDKTGEIEGMIDKLDAELPKLTTFILPGGSMPSGFAHLCRTVCRKAERKVWKVHSTTTYTQDANVLTFLNRLSDYFFVLARYANFVLQVEEQRYV